eukprot:160593-Prymnesium_polylepis.1
MTTLSLGLAYAVLDPHGFFVVERAQRAFGVGRYAEAALLYAQAIAVRPAEARLHLQHGIALVADDRRGEAVLSFDSAIELEPDHAHARRLAANARAAIASRAARAEGGGVGQRSTALLESALRTEPERYEHYHRLGLALHAEGSQRRAMEAFEHATKLAPNVASVRRWVRTCTAHQIAKVVRVNVATIQLGLDRVKEARQSLDTALALQPTLLSARVQLFALSPPTADSIARLSEALAATPAPAPRSQLMQAAAVASNFEIALLQESAASSAELAWLASLRSHSYAIVDGPLGAATSGVLRDGAARELQQRQRAGTVGRDDTAAVRRATRSDAMVRLPSELSELQLTPSLEAAIGELRALFLQ